MMKSFKLVFVICHALYIMYMYFTASCKSKNSWVNYYMIVCFVDLINAFHYVNRDALYHNEEYVDSIFKS